MSTIADSLKWCSVCNAATHHDNGQCSLPHPKEKILMNEKKEALKDIQKRYEADGQSEALRLAYKKYGHLGETHHCCGCETDTLFIDKQCCVCGGVLPEPPKEYYIKFVADDGYTHFAKFSHSTKTQKQLEEDWSLSIREAIKARKMEWQHNDILLNMKNKGWRHEALNTVQLDY